MFKKIASTFSTKVITSLINLLIVVIISRTMGPEGKGEASLIVTTIALVMMLCNIVGGATLVYLVPRYNFFQLFLLSWLWTFISCAVVWFVYIEAMGMNCIRSGTGKYWDDIILLSILSSFLLVNITLLLGKERILSNNMISLLQSTLNLGVLVFMVYQMKEPNVSSYIQSLNISLSACTVISLLMIARHFTSFSMNGFGALIKESFRLGFANQLGHVMQFLSLRISYYLLEGVNGNEAVGVYSNGVSIVESIWLITNSIAIVQYARIANSDDKTYSQQLTLKLTRFSSAVCILALAVMILLPPGFFMWLFGEGFGQVNEVIWVLAPGVLFYNTGLIIGHYFSGTGKYHVNTAGNFAGLMVTAIGSYLFIESYSIYSAGIIASIAYLVMSLYVIIVFMKESRAGIGQLIPSPGDLKDLLRAMRE